MGFKNRIEINRLAAACSAILGRHRRDSRNSVLGLAALSAAMLAGTAAWAQDDTEEVVLVTGSRIVGSGMRRR